MSDFSLRAEIRYAGSFVYIQPPVMLVDISFIYKAPSGRELSP